MELIREGITYSADGTAEAANLSLFVCACVCMLCVSLSVCESGSVCGFLRRFVSRLDKRPIQN